MQKTELAERFEEHGLVHLENVLSPEQIDILKKFTLDNLKENHNKSFFLTSKSNHKISDFFK